MRNSLFCLLLLLAVPASASVRLGNEVRVPSAHPQVYPVTAQAGSHQLTVWTNPDTLDVEGLIDGKAVLLGTTHDYTTPPTVAANPLSFLVAWVDPSPTKLFARRVGFDGSLPDSKPIEIGPALEGFTPDTVAIVPDQASFSIWWGADADLRLAHVTAGIVSGVIIQDWASVGRVVSHTRSAALSSAAPQVFFGEDRPSNVICSPVTCWTGYFGTLAYDNTSGMLQANEVFSGISHDGPFDVASDGTRFTYFWWGDDGSTAQSLYASQSSGDGQILMMPKSVYRRTPWSNPPAVQAVWNENETIVVWQETGSDGYADRGIRVDASGNPIDSAPFTFAEGSLVPGIPSLIETEAGALVTYSKLDDKGVPRAYQRTIDSTAATRRRAVGH